jgi:predicted glycosyl hydrolase (DUF1957 family)
MAPQSSGDGNQGPGQGDELYAEPKDEDAASADAASAEAKANRLLNESSADQSEEDRVLDDVLKETVRAVSGKAALDMIRQVANRAGNEDVSELHTCEELVREIMKGRFKIGALPGEIPARVAENLLEDPQVNARLVALWNEVRGQ